MRKLITRAAIIAAAASVPLAAPASADAPGFHGPDNLPRYMTHPCASEDSPGPCYWDASTAGNGRGWSFYVIPLRGRRSAVVYWDHPRASFVTESGR